MALITLKSLQYRMMVGRKLFGINWGHNKVENKEWDGGWKLDKTSWFPLFMIFRGVRGNGPSQGVEDALIFHLIPNLRGDASSS